ncbi:hypothetical protein GCM10022381_41380 [Leifsonia kafniensis]|uniref:Glucose/Sorbosone dehydrogenase domain-containing protein n=1 Tax=Leifsonia kafniensis TaxID=475957 RepID=A0ABP7L7X4_9MICO
MALPVRPVGDPVAIASHLDAPWSILRLPMPGGGTLISERDTATIRELLPDGSLRAAGTVAESHAGGEGGLLGLAFLAASAAPIASATPSVSPGASAAPTVSPGASAAPSVSPGFSAGLAPSDSGWVYAYVTAADDNRIVRMPLTGSAGGYGLGASELVLAGIPKAANHDGGRIAFGPDGLLYATAGDAGNTANAQDLGSLGGKILRMTATGEVPAGNPFGTLVYSWGHRNPQGIAWDVQGQLWASEFGQNTWDELNRIVAGGNYGWPIVEGIAPAGAADPALIDPVHEWPTDEASPSGIAIVGDSLFMASLRGERLWRIQLSTGEVDDWFVHDFGRLRDVVSGPDGTLWFMSNNTDGRGDPAAGDDRLYQVQVSR